MDKLIIPIDDKEQLEVYSHVGPFDNGVAALKAEGLELITARELAEARILAGPKHPVSQSGTWVAEHPIYLPNKEADILIVDRAHSLLVKSAREAADANRGNKDFYLDEAVVDELRGLATPDGKNGVLFLPRNALPNSVPIKALAENAFMRFLFGDQAEAYSRFLGDVYFGRSISAQFIYDNRDLKGGSPLCRALWVGNIYRGIDDYYLLHHGLGQVLGVRRAPAP